MYRLPFLSLVTMLLTYGCASTQQTPSNDLTTTQIQTFFTFQKFDSEEAMNLYISLFDNSKVVDIQRWEEGEMGKVGTIKKATFILNGKTFACSDSPITHEWNITPGVSNFVECRDLDELTRLFQALSKDGKVYMPMGNYGFSQQFAFVEDKFGVSWQLNMK